MDWNSFFKSVREGRFERVYFFTGPEALTKREAISALRSALLPPGLEALNEATLEGCGAQEIIGSANTLPVMCERRLVVVRDWGPLASGRAKNEEKDVERMLAWLEDPPESAVVVFLMTVEPDGRKKLPGKLKKLPGCVEFARLSGATLAKWCNQRLKPFGKKLAPDAMEELSLMAGQDLTRLAGELEKLAAYVGEAKEIAPDDVRAVVAPSAEYSAFVILDHLLEGRPADAARAVNGVLLADPRAVRLISMIANQLRIDAHMKFAMERGGNLPEVQKQLGVSEYRARHIVRQIRPLKADALLERYLRCVEAEFAVKSGKLRERAALDALMEQIVVSKTATK